jgi:mannose/fructose/N-acetylgalactosamine-specific phosphotransferase system component IID
MYIVPIAWLYVTLMMSVAEATNTTGTVLGAVITFVLYGLLPVGLILYFMGSPARKRAIHAAQAKERAEYAKQAASLQPDASGQPPGDPLAPVGKEP